LSIVLGKNDVTEEIVSLKKKTLKRHICTLGTSGSGKTVFCKVVVEEAVRQEIPVLIVDPQGDIASLGLPGDPATLQEKGYSPEFAEEYLKNAEVRIWTPASSKGIALSINPLKFSEEEMDVEDIIKAVDNIAATLIRFVGYDPENDKGKAAQAYLFQLLDHFREQKVPLTDLKTLAKYVESPPDVLQETVSEIINKNEIGKLAKKIRFLTTGANKLLFEMGIALDIDTLLTPVEKGKIPVNVIYMNTLNTEADKHFFIAVLGRQLYEWMLRHPKDETQLIFYVDEIAPYLPPHPYNPPPKESLKLLMKQGRKYGISNLIATQNPADIDYKAMAQANTWVLGRMMTKQDISNVHHMLKSLNPAKADDIIARLPTLSAGEFLLICPDEFKENVIQFNARWLVTEHKTIDEEDIQDAMPEAVINYFKQIVKEQEAIRKKADIEKMVEKTTIEEVQTIETIPLENHKILDPETREEAEQYQRNEFLERKVDIYFMSTIGPGEKKQKLSIDTDQMVNNIKDTVSNLFGLNPTEVHLSYNGVTLDENSTLKEFNIMDGDTILLIPSSRAG
jgi:hypothetical protein